jgi:NAD(P)-dependent dehydrogenase (short-subunit alcohol dehydrogenase family)
LIGGTKGLGRVLAELFSADGHRVSVVARNAPADPLASLPGVEFQPADLRSRESIEAAMRALVQKRGAVSNLIFIQRSRMPAGTPRENWENELQISLLASRAAIEALQDQFTQNNGGSIVFVSSMGGVLYADGQPLEYGIAKAGFNQMVRHYSVTLGSRQIRVNGVACYTFLKDESKSHFLQNKKLQTAIRQVVPMRRMATATDMAKAIRLLCSQDAGFVSGQIVVVDGGLSAVGQETVAFWASGVRERSL